jgi:hypothetical protein
MRTSIAIHNRIGTIIRILRTRIRRLSMGDE